MGGAFGLLVGSTDPMVYDEKLSTKAKVKQSFKEMGQKSWSYGKSFGVVGAVYTVFECNIEKVIAVAPMLCLWRAWCNWWRC